MPFVKTNRFPLPTVTRADGTLGAYVQASPPTSGPNFIWPAQRVAIYQAQLKAAQAAQKKKKLFSFFNLFGAPAAPAPSTIRKKGAVQTPAPRLKGLGADQGGPLVIPGDSVIAADGTTTLPNGTVINPQGQVTNSATDVLSTLFQAATNLAANKGKQSPPQQTPTSPLAGISAGTLGIGAAAFAALVIGLAAGGRKR